MQKILLLLLFFLLNGCSLNSLLALGEVDKVQVVKYTPYLKHHRAYFTRTHLKPMKNGKKYLYLYNSKQKDLAILFHRKNQYILYSLSKPNKKLFTFIEDRNTRYYHVLKSLKRKGYRLASPHKVGYTSRVGLRRYKGIKTLLVEAKDYTRLKEIYEKAIRTYDAKAVKPIQTILPKPLIYAYYERYRKRAKSKKQLEQLQIIASKLQLNSAITISSDPQEKTEDEVQKELERERKQELEREREEEHKKRRTVLKEERLLREGSLEELITAYKTNKDPRYKKRILILMKEVQENK